MLRLWELGTGDEVPPTIHVCQDCLTQREIRAWPQANNKARLLEEALNKHLESHGRYSYMADLSKIHLVRLHPKWVAKHAEA